MGIFGSHKTRMVAPEEALTGRSTPLAVPARHEVLGTPLRPPYPEGLPGGRGQGRRLRPSVRSGGLQVS